jgi:ferritin-like metal-binding protein YciE
MKMNPPLPAKQRRLVAKIEVTNLLPRFTKMTPELKKHLSDTEKNCAALQRVLDRFRKALKESGEKDKLANFEMADLLKRYSEAETLAASILKKRDDTANAVIGKI